MDWLDDKEKSKNKPKNEDVVDAEFEEEDENEPSNESDPSEWQAIKGMELALREENKGLVNVKQRAEVKQAPKNETVKADQLGMPKLCDQCYLIDKCPHYEEGATCYFRNMVQVKGPESMLDIMKMMLELQGERVMFGRFIEQSEGGYIDANLSKEMKLMMDLMKDFKELISDPQDEISIRVKGSAARGGGTTEDTPHGQNAGGILSQIFGGK